jgi:hypothetical protein
MYKNASLKIYTRTVLSNVEGTRMETWGTAPIDEFRADVQPKNLSEADRELYGVSDMNANVKIVFCKNRPSLVTKNRALVTTDGGGGEVKYTVQPLNCWPNHAEFLLIPVVGE